VTAAWPEFDLLGWIYGCFLLAGRCFFDSGRNRHFKQSLKARALGIASLFPFSSKITGHLQSPNISQE
jgi:hypothetical protein